MLDKGTKGFEQRFEMLIRFLFEDCYSAGAVYIDKSENCTFYLRYGRLTPWRSWRYIWLNLKFFFVIGFKRTLKIIKMSEDFFEAHSKNSQYIYLCMTGAVPDSQGTGLFSNMFDFLMSEADKESLSVFLETSNERNVKIYESRGFYVYKEWRPNDGSELVVWLMKRQAR